MGEAITNVVISFFTHGSLPGEANNSLIVLIPKTTNPTSVNSFRPISLYNVVQMDCENQVVVHELLHSFKTRRVKSGFMAVKLDLQKAYDRCNWKFIQAVLTNLEFNSVSPIRFESEVLLRMLDNELRAGNISGAKPSAKGPVITYVMYTNDIILFSKATRNDAKRLSDCLGKYCD
ncbi:uncharacterized protein LOC142630010 [Castanea sativa]|uniref:uncharacterized protein LOC142630010 n=1 Tax=Castanea sativa TaxID=21020 RepID=UPI003F652E6F